MSRDRGPERRDMLLSIGVALVLVGALVFATALLRGQIGNAAASALMIAAGVALWRWRRSRIG